MASLLYILAIGGLSTIINLLVDMALGIKPNSLGDWVGFFLIYLVLIYITLPARKRTGGNAGNNDLFPGM